MTLANDSGDNLTIFDRQQRPEIYYRVKLENAPQRNKLSLGCDWIDSRGQIVHQNRYQTKTMNKEGDLANLLPLSTGNAQTGTWQVKMTMGDRILSQTEFTVK